MDRFDKQVFALIVSVILLLVIAVSCDCQEKERLIKQCLSDGKKEYECRAMFRENHSTVVIGR